VRRAAAPLVALALLGLGCAEERGPRPEASSAEPQRRCDVRPGAIPEGFTLRRTREISQGGQGVGIREEYRDRDGRLLVYLLGVAGEVGEGLPFVSRPTLTTGGRARFLGEAPNWVLAWNDEPPCSQMSIVGNGFEQEEFLGLLQDAGVIEPS
jgi:hypothetical protein